MPGAHAAAGVTMGPLVSVRLCHDHFQVYTRGVTVYSCGYLSLPFWNVM